jgi:hypothetical protein
MTTDELKEYLNRGERLVDIKFHISDRGHEALIVTQIGKLLNIPTIKDQAIIHQLLLSGNN